MPKSYAMNVIAETHKFWKDLTEVNAQNASSSGMKREGSGVWTHTSDEATAEGAHVHVQSGTSQGPPQH